MSDSRLTPPPQSEQPALSPPLDPDGLSRAELAALARADQRRRWQRGEHVPVEEYLRRWPALAADAEVLLDLVYAEVVVREEQGEAPSPEEYQARFPEHAAALARQFALHRALAGSLFPAVPAPAGAEAQMLPPAEGDPGATAPTAERPAEARGATKAAGLPQPVPGYDVLSELGRGGMGVVYKARHLRLNRVVALKMVLGGAHATEQDLVRFLHEAEAVAALRHPNVVQVYDSGQHDGLPYCALEFVPGGSLADRLKQGPLPAKEAAELTKRIAEGVQAAHAKGIVHRDLKPANVLLDADGTPKVTDFGLAKRVEGGSGLTQTGAIMGTPSYMAPEQASGEGKKVGPAADVWALGAILYECLTGRPPFRAATPLDTILQVLSAEPAPVRQLQPSVPRDLETVCHKALNKEAGKRYASAAAMAEDLRRFLKNEPIAARPVGWVERGWRWCRRNPLVAGLIGAVAVALLLGTAVATGFALYARAQEEAARASEQGAKTALAAAEEEKDLKGRQLMTVQLMRVAAVYEHEPGKAKALLSDGNACPTPLRDTTWRFYDRCCSRWEIAAIRGHVDQIRSVAFSPDGQTLATGSVDQTVCLWDVKTGHLKGTFKGHTDPVWAVAFSPDGLTLASGSGRYAQGKPLPGEVRLWDVQTGQHKATLRGHTAHVVSVAFSPDGLTLASASLDQTVKLWDVKSWQVEATLRGHTGGVYSMAFSPDGQTLASGSAARDDQKEKPPGEVRLWDVKTGQHRATLRGDLGGVTYVAFSPDGLTLASGSEPSTVGVQLWDVNTGQMRASLQDQGGPVAFSPDGLTLASTSSHEVCLWDARTGRHKATLSGHEHPVSSLAFSPDGACLASASSDSFKSGKPGEVRLWDVTTSQHKAILSGHTKTVESVAFSPDGETIASASWGETRLWVTKTGQTKATFQAGGWVMAYSPDGLTLAGVWEGQDAQRKPLPREVCLWDVKTGQIKATLQGHTNAVESVAFSPDGLTLASGSRGFDPEGKRVGWVQLWDVKTARPRTTLEGAQWPVAFDRDGFTFASGSMDKKTVRLWCLATGEVLATLQGHTDWVESVAFNPDGVTLASGSRDGAVRLWDVRTGRPAAALQGHTSSVDSMAFSPDGLTLATGSADGTVRLWEVKTGQARAILRGATSPVMFSPDGLTLATGSDDNTVRLWALGSDNPERNRAEWWALEPVNRVWWHQQQAAQAEKAQNWFAAAFHLSQLLKKNPDDADLKRRLDQVRDRLKAPAPMEPLPQR